MSYFPSVLFFIFNDLLIECHYNVTRSAFVKYLSFSSLSNSLSQILHTFYYREQVCVSIFIW